MRQGRELHCHPTRDVNVNNLLQLIISCQYYDIGNPELTKEESQMRC